MTRRCLERVDEEHIRGELRILRVLSDTAPGRDAGAGLVRGGALGVSDPVSWFLIEPGWEVVGADGESVGKVHEVVGDQERDIFDGLRGTRRAGRASPATSSVRGGRGDHRVGRVQLAA